MGAVAFGVRFQHQFVADVDGVLHSGDSSPLPACSTPGLGWTSSRYPWCHFHAQRRHRSPSGVSISQLKISVAIRAACVAVLAVLTESRRPHLSHVTRKQLAYGWCSIKGVSSTINEFRLAVRSAGVLPDPVLHQSALPIDQSHPAFIVPQNSGAGAPTGQEEPSLYVNRVARLRWAMV